MGKTAILPDLNPNLAQLEAALDQVWRERHRQMRLLAEGKIKCNCADPATPLEKAFLVLTEEFAESAIECNRIVENRRLRYGALRTELIQTAAVAVAMVEALDARA